MFTYDPIADGYMVEIVQGQYATATKKNKRWYGWLFYKHPDGQWVSLRKMTPEELNMYEHFGLGVAGKS